MLVGWVDSYSPQILKIFIYTIIVVLLILVVYTRRLVRHPAAVLIGMILTSIWGVGFMGLFGYNLDPLMLVVPFLISARSMSHGIQKVERYFLELSRPTTRRRRRAIPSTRCSAPARWRSSPMPAALALIGLGSVPINDKMSIYASFWAVCMVVTVLMTVPDAAVGAAAAEERRAVKARLHPPDLSPEDRAGHGHAAARQAVLWTCLVIAHHLRLLQLLGADR